MIHSTIRYVAVALALGASSSAYAEGCRLRVETSSASWVVRGYDPFSIDEPSGTFDVTFANDGDGACSFRPTFDLLAEPYGLRQRGAGTPLRYTLLDIQGSYDATPRAGSTARSPARRVMTVPPGGQEMVRYQLTVDPTAIAADGEFTQIAQISAETPEGDSLGSRQLTLGIVVKPSVVMGLTGAFTRSQGRAIVDLGELGERTASPPLSLYLQSTRGYRVSVRSQNNGNLVLAGTRWAVPYSLTVGDRTLSLASEANYTSSTGTALAREMLPLQFAVGSVEAKRAGVYSDTLTVTVEVN